jgi:ribose 5-phosphate isomerase B
MKIAIGNDHGGLQLADACRDWLNENNIYVIDCGTNTADSVHYPVYAKKVVEEILQARADFGILVCGTGIGISIAANKWPDIRCGLCSDITTARLTRQHNDANILAMGGRIIGIEVGLDIVKTFVNTEFEGGRHAERIKLIER